jgi:Protein of unknown function (DUF1553)/Protein of unknown function (DUF1549)/Planctomycete cytochrome C
MMHFLQLMLAWFALPLIPFTLYGAGTLSQDSRTVPRFNTEILPIFQAKCLVCHGEALRQHGLDLRTRDSLLKGGESGPAIVPGSARASLLYKKVDSGTMPLGGEKLSPPEIERIRKWIEAGALNEGEDPEAAKGQLPGKQVTEQEIMVAIFQSKCITCHGKWVKEAGLDLRTRAGYLKGGKSGPAVVPGKPEKSLAYLRIVGGEMPPKVPKGSPHYVRPVTASETERLQQWIAAGAPAGAEEVMEVGEGPDPLVTDKDRKFWSFQPPACPPVPKVSNADRVRTPIDAFLLKRLEAQGLSFSQDSDRLKLMRRAYFDLTGLPPSAEEVDAYLKDTRSDVYERLIDRLLASPHYGERWAKYWLDAAGYADSHGKIDADRVRPNAWRYRDYVIRSLNSDKPYDRFLLEQIAGDELFDYKAAKALNPEQRDYLVATGFLRTAADDTDEAVLNLVSYRWALLADQVNIFSSAVMGLTMECARCHSHKYDPIPHRDYYRFSAIFQSALDPFDWRISSTVIYAGEEGQVPIPLRYQRFLNLAPEGEAQDVTRFNAPILEEIRRLESALEAKAKPLRDKLLEEKIEKLPESIRQDVRKAIQTPKEKRTDVESYLVDKFAAALKVESKEIEERFKNHKDEAEKTRKAIQEAKKKLKPTPQIRALFDTGGEPTPAYIFQRGDCLKPGARVKPGVPSVLRDGIAPYKVSKPTWTTDTSGQRLALARWLIQPNHPLTTRVMVNRVWLHHFGRGLVETPANFGRIGAKPSNPELVDWLATEFVRQDWSLKSLHKLIMTSTAYRQSSVVTPRSQEVDPDNTLLSRFPLRRLDAEAIRDALLKVSGRLDLTAFGPPEEVQLTPEGEVISKGSSAGFRRSIYLQQRRSLPLTLLELFDAPRMDPNAIMRAHSTVPTQALQLWNSDMLRESSRYLAGRVVDAVGENAEKEVERIHLMVYARPASNGEKKLGSEAILEFTRHWQEQIEKEVPAEPKILKARWLALANYCHAILNSAEFTYVD